MKFFRFSPKTLSRETRSRRSFQVDVLPCFFLFSFLYCVQTTSEKLKTKAYQIGWVTPATVTTPKVSPQEAVLPVLPRHFVDP